MITRRAEIVRMQFGSHVYGTNLPTSDFDYKAVFLPSIEDLILQRATKTSIRSSTGPENAKNAPGDIDVEEFSIQGYMRLLCEGQTVAIDMLFTPSRFYIGEPSLAWRMIRERKSLFLSSGVCAFVGYCKQQANKYGVKGSRMAAARDAIDFLRSLGDDTISSHWGDVSSWAAGREHVELVCTSSPWMLSVCGRKAPSNLKASAAVSIYEALWERYGERARQAMNSEGVDWKALMHAVRVLGEAEELLATGSVTMPRPDREHLLNVRTGKVPYAEVAAEIEAGMERLGKIEPHSSLRKDPDRKAADDLILEAYLAGP